MKLELIKETLVEDMSKASDVKEFVLKNPEMTAKQVATILNISMNDVSSAMSRLRKSGTLSNTKNTVNPTTDINKTNENEFETLYKKLKEYETDDYQNRDGKYPRANVPDYIEVYKNNNAININAVFKSTSESSAKTWLERKILSRFDIKPSSVTTGQEGDYENDWVYVEAVFNIKPNLAEEMSKASDVKDFILSKPEYAKLTAKEISAKLDIPFNDVSSAMSRLRKAGKLGGGHNKPLPKPSTMTKNQNQTKPVVKSDKPSVNRERADHPVFTNKIVEDWYYSRTPYIQKKFRELRNTISDGSNRDNWYWLDIKSKANRNGEKAFEMNGDMAANNIKNFFDYLVFNSVKYPNNRLPKELFLATRNPYQSFNKYADLPEYTKRFDSYITKPNRRSWKDLLIHYGLSGKEVERKDTPDDKKSWTLSWSVSDYEHDGDLQNELYRLEDALKEANIDRKKLKVDTEVEPGNEDWDGSARVIVSGVGLDFKQKVSAALNNM